MSDTPATTTDGAEAAEAADAASATREAGTAEVDSPAARRARVPAPVAGATRRLFGALSRGRGTRIFHPRGIALTGTARMTGLGVRLAGRESADVVVRLSRGLGLRSPLPDFNGVAVKFPDAHGPGRDQDLLLVSAPRPPVARHVLVPLPSFGSSGTSTILPYRTPDGLVVFRTDPLPDLGAHGDPQLPLQVRLLAAPLLGRWEAVGELTLVRRLSDDESDEVSFDPWNTGDDVVPAGFLNRLRRPAYAGSRAGRPEEASTEARQVPGDR